MKQATPSPPPKKTRFPAFTSYTKRQKWSSDSGEFYAHNFSKSGLRQTLWQTRATWKSRERKTQEYFSIVLGEEATQQRYHGTEEKSVSRRPADWQQSCPRECPGVRWDFTMSGKSFPSMSLSAFLVLGTKGSWGRWDPLTLDTLSRILSSLPWVAG